MLEILFRSTLEYAYHAFLNIAMITNAFTPAENGSTYLKYTVRTNREININLKHCMSRHKIRPNDANFPGQ